MKRIVVVLTMALMVLASVSCTKKMVPLYLKGTTWVCPESDDIAVLKFDTRRSFLIDVYEEGLRAFTIKFRIAEVIDDQVNFEFASISVAGEGLDVAQEGMLLLQGRRDMDLVITSHHWREIDEESRSHLVRDDKFNILNYLK